MKIKEIVQTIGGLSILVAIATWIIGFLKIVWCYKTDIIYFKLCITSFVAFLVCRLIDKIIEYED